MSNGQQDLCIALGVVFMVLPILAVGARVWAVMIRETSQFSTRLHADDYLIFAALIFAEGTGATVAHGNLGQRLTYSFSPETPDQIGALVVFLKAEYVFLLFAQLSILASKLSLLALYRRIFIMRTFQWAVVIVGSIVVVWHTIFIFLFILRCNPVQAIWDLELDATAKCLNALAIWKAYAVSDVLTDALVLSLPIPAITSLQMSARKKFGVSMMFSLGAVVIATGVTRTIFFFIIAKESLAEITYNSAPCLYWSFVETSLAVIGACLPPMRLLFSSEGKGTLVSKMRGFMSFLSSKGSKGENDVPSSQSAEALKSQVYISRSVAVNLS